MNGQISWEQMQNLLTFNALILMAVVVRLISLAVWRKWLADDPTDGMTQEERDLWIVDRKGRRRR